MANLGPFNDGTLETPALRFRSQVNLGIFREAASTIAFSVNGVLGARLTASEFHVVVGGIKFPDGTTQTSAGADISSGVTVSRLVRFSDSNTIADSLLSDDTANVTLVSGTLRLPNGSAAAPSLVFTSDPDTGIFRQAADAIGFSLNGAEVARLQLDAGFSLPQLLAPDGSGSAVAGLSFIGDTDTGWSSSGAGAITMIIGGTQQIVYDGSLSALSMDSNLKWRGLDGTPSEPGISFSSETNTGLFRVSSGVLAIGTLGTQRVRFESSGVTLATGGQFRSPFGTAASPPYSFSSATGTGIYGDSGSGGTLYFATAGLERGSINSVRVNFQHPLQMLSGSAAAPVYSFTSATTSGLFLTGTNAVAISVGGTERARISTAGDLGIATTSPNSKLHVNGSAAYAFASTSADITLDSTHNFVAVSASAANRTITLPTAAGITGREYTVKKTDATSNTVTIDGAASETIDGDLTLVLVSQYQSVTLVSDGTNWLVK